MKKILFFLLFIFTTITHGYGDFASFGQDILLIINYSHPYYDSITFFKELYGEFFPNIVFYGPPPRHPEVGLCIQDKGFYSYRSLTAAMLKYPEYRGYLWVHDDCIINFWNFLRFNKNRLWLTKFWRYGNLSQENDGLQEYGYNAIQRSYYHLNEKQKAILIKNCGENIIPVGYSDIVYIPARYREDAIELLSLFSYEKVFLGIAIPTTCACLSNEDQWMYIKGRALWDQDRNDLKKIEAEYHSKYDFFHPIKLSDEACRDFVRRKFKEILGQANSYSLKFNSPKV